MSNESADFDYGLVMEQEVDCSAWSRLKVSECHSCAQVGTVRNGLQWESHGWTSECVQEANGSVELEKELGMEGEEGSFEEEVGRLGACVRKWLGSWGLVRPPGSGHPESSISGALWILFTYMNPAVMDLLISYLFFPLFSFPSSFAIFSPFLFPFLLSSCHI